MAYYSSPRKYEYATGKRFTTNCSCIHVTGSVRGMVKLGFWDKNSDNFPTYKNAKVDGGFLRVVKNKIKFVRNNYQLVESEMEK